MTEGGVEMTTIEKHVDVNVPATVAYDQWTQFESFPQFMGDVKKVRQLDDETLLWQAEIGGVSKDWKARITERIPDKRIAWTSISGSRNAGCVTFHRLSDDRTRVMLQLEYQVREATEKAGEVLRLPERGVERDLEQFKDFIERRGEPTGAVARRDPGEGRSGLAARSV